MKNLYLNDIIFKLKVLYVNNLEELFKIYDPTTFFQNKFKVTDQ